MKPGPGVFALEGDNNRLGEEEGLGLDDKGRSEICGLTTPEEITLVRINTGKGEYGCSYYYYYYFFFL